MTREQAEQMIADSGVPNAEALAKMLAPSVRIESQPVGDENLGFGASRFGAAGVSVAAGAAVQERRDVHEHFGGVKPGGSEDVGVATRRNNPDPLATLHLRRRRPPQPLGSEALSKLGLRSRLL